MGKVVTNAWKYGVDGAVGRFEFLTHQIVDEEQILYDTAYAVFPRRRCWEWYKTIGFKELGLIHGATEQSYRKTARWLNRVRQQEGATPATTIREGVEQEGARILEYVERKTTEILRREGFTADGRPVMASPAYVREPAVVSSVEVRQAILNCGLNSDEQAEVEKNPVIYEQAPQSVNISLDEVVVKKQKDERPQPSKGPGRGGQTAEDGKDTRKYVHNTVAHIQHLESSYTVSGQSVLAVLRVILGYLVHNQLLPYRLQFFVDGQKTLQAAIVRAFSWFANLGLILDWYHLEDKCQRQLSLAMNGKDRRNAVLHELTRLLWYGMVDKAVAYLRNLEDDGMKDPAALRVLIGYIERNRP
jgi:hypothetical protein